MSDVKRYQIGGRDIPASAAVFLPSEVVSSADYDALAAAHEQAWKSATSESHAWAREYEARMLVVAERDTWEQRACKEATRVVELGEKCDRLEAELKAINDQQAVATLLPGDPCDERPGFYLSLEDKQRLADLPAGTKLYALPPSSGNAITDTQRLDFILRKCRTVIVERLPNDYLEVYVEEGFMGETQHPVIAHRGDWAEASAEAAAVKRKAIDAAILWCETDGDAAKDGSA